MSGTEPQRDADEGARWWEIDIDANRTGDEGSFLLGLLAGLIGGLPVIVLVIRRARPNTRWGVCFGAVLQISLGFWLIRYLESTGALPSGALKIR